MRNTVTNLHARGAGLINLHARGAGLIKLPVVLFFGLAVGSLASLTGCPAQSACPPCFVGGVMASGSSEPNPNPKATVNLQLGRGYSKGVSEVHITLTDAKGNRETVSYGADKVGTLDSASMLTIADNEVYAVGDQPPTSAEVEIVFSNGDRASDRMSIKSE